MLPKGYDHVRIMINTKYYNQNFWIKNSKELSFKLLELSKDIIPGLLSDFTECIGRATPVTMKNYTYNSEGAVAGWMNSVEQIDSPILEQAPVIENLYFSGHWVTQAYGNGGVAMAADSGRKVARKIIKNEKRL